MRDNLKGIEMNNNSDGTSPQGECQNISYHLPKWTENGEVIWDDATAQHKSLNAEAHCIKPPTKVIPVIFIPGIMGTNLMSTTSDEKEIWRGDSLAAVYWEWHSKNGYQRQKLLNPNTTCVDNKGNIEKEILTHFSDDGCIFPSRKERNWGAALGFSYGRFLNVLQGALLDDWQTALANFEKNYKFNDPETMETINVTLKYTGTLSKLVGKKFDTLEKENEEVLTPDEFKHFKRFLFPVHVFGYNWLQDNKISAESLKIYIEDVLRLYREKHGYGLAQEKVILVTHSMGGLIARYASQVLGMKDKILGIVHGVIPDLGSPAAYRRMKVGAEGEGFLGTAGHVLGSTAEELMPVLAQAPAALQLLPSPKYPSSWLAIKNFSIDNDRVLPKIKDPFNEIYLQEEVWWRLYESDIIDKDNVTSENNWINYAQLIDGPVRKFVYALDKADYHPNTYVFYGDSEKSDGSLTWKEIDFTIYNIKPPTKHRRIKTSGTKTQEFKLMSSETPGDGTVPIESFNMIKNSKSIKSILATDVEHQSAYEVSSLSHISSKPAIQFTLRAIAKMIKDIPQSESQ